MIVGIISLGIWMLLIVLDIWGIKERLDRLESEKLTKSEVDNGNAD